MKGSLLRLGRRLLGPHGRRNCPTRAHARSVHVLPHLSGRKGRADDDNARDNGVLRFLRHRSVMAVSVKLR
jgi:hypothetical protein